MASLRFVAPAGAPLRIGDLARATGAVLRGSDVGSALRRAIQARFGVNEAFLTATGRAGLTVLLRALRRLPAALGISFSGGVLSGLLGIGGGILQVPALNAWCGIPMRAAAALTAAVIGITALGSAPIYYARGRIIAPLKFTGGQQPRCGCRQQAKDNQQDKGMREAQPHLSFFSKSSAAEFTQKRRPVGCGPSGKTCPRCPPQRLQCTSVRVMK